MNSFDGKASSQASRKKSYSHPELEDREAFLGQYIPLHYHYAMLQDQYRLTAFEAAIKRVVRPGSRVVDLGGGTGILSYFAARAGARVAYVERLSELAKAASNFLATNGVGHQVEVIHGDAATYTPSEPVDVVLCEMLHSMLACEQQHAVTASFKRNYTQTFGIQLPVFVPSATVLGFEPLQHDFDFSGYHAPIPVFQNSQIDHPRSSSLSAPIVYHIRRYTDWQSETIRWTGAMRFERAGTFNALRFVTQNILCAPATTQTGFSGQCIDWYNQSLVLPLPRVFSVSDQTVLHLELDYDAGCSLQEVGAGIRLSENDQVLGLY